MGCCVPNHRNKVRNILRKSTEPTRSTGVTNSLDEVMTLPFALQPRPSLAAFPSQIPSQNVMQKQLSKINILQEDPQQLYYFNYQIGKGAFSLVFQMQQKHTGKLSACKAIKLISKDHLTQIKNQIALMSMLDSPYTLKYHNSYFNQFVVYIFMEYIEGGSLRDFIDAYSNGIEEDAIAYILQQIILGVNVIHSKGIVHRDLKADNVLFGKDGTIKVSDLGIAQMLTKKHTKLHNLIGTPAMMAPEMIKRQPYDQNIDIWALGIMAYELYKGKVPVNTKCDQMTLQIIARSPVPMLKDASEQLQDFLGCCLQLEASKRYGTQRLCNHPFIRNKACAGKQKFLKMVQKITAIDDDAVSQSA